MFVRFPKRILRESKLSSKVVSQYFVQLAFKDDHSGELQRGNTDTLTGY